MAISVGAIVMNPANNIPLPMSRYDKFADNTTFIGRSFQWVDPQKEMNASISGMQSGLVTFQDVQANYGRDVEELFEQHEREERLAEQYGIKTAFQPFGVKLPAEPDVTQGETDGETE
jgi:capsid protein